MTSERDQKVMIKLIQDVKAMSVQIASMTSQIDQIIEAQNNQKETER